MQETILPNGLKVVYYPIKNALSIAVGLYVKAGSRYENSENNGITHFLEHLHFRQLADMKQDDIYYNMEKIGSTLKGSTFKSMLRFRMKVRPRYFKDCLAFFENILTTYSWDEDDFNSEREVILREIEEKHNYVDNDAIVARAIWGESSLSLPILGTTENIERFTLSEIIEYKEKIFTNQNLILIITGAISDNEIALVNDSLGDISLDSRSQPSNEILFNKRGPDVEIVDYDWNCSDIVISFDIDLKQVSYEKAMLLNAIIGGGTGSLLQMQVREKHGLSYNIYSEVDMYGDVATINIHLTTSKSKIYECIERIVQVLSGAKTDIDAKCMEVNMPFFSENLWYWLENPETLNEELMWQGYANDGKGFTIEDKSRKYGELNLEDMMAAAREIFKPENATVVIIGDSKGITKKRIRDTIKHL